MRACVAWLHADLGERFADASLFFLICDYASE